MTFTEPQIRTAFFAVFNESGEQWFPYQAMNMSAEECEESTESYWQEMLSELKKTQP